MTHEMGHGRSVDSARTAALPSAPRDDFSRESVDLRVHRERESALVRAAAPFAPHERWVGGFALAAEGRLADRLSKLSAMESIGIDPYQLDRICRHGGSVRTDSGVDVTVHHPRSSKGRYEGMASCVLELQWPGGGWGIIDTDGLLVCLDAPVFTHVRTSVIPEGPLRLSPVFSPRAFQEVFSNAAGRIDDLQVLYFYDMAIEGTKREFWKERDVTVQFKNDPAVAALPPALQSECPDVVLDPKGAAAMEVRTEAGAVKIEFALRENGFVEATWRLPPRSA